MLRAGRLSGFGLLSICLCSLVSSVFIFHTLKNRWEKGEGQPAAQWITVIYANDTSLGCAHLLMSFQAWHSPQSCSVLLFFHSLGWPDKPAMKINDPTLSDSSGNWRAERVIYHPLTGAIQLTQALQLAAITLSIFCFIFRLSFSFLLRNPFFFSTS